MARFDLTQFETLSGSVNAIRYEAGERLTKLGVPKAPFSLSVSKLKHILRNMEEHNRATVQEVRILKREFDLVDKHDQYETAAERIIRYHMMRRFLAAAEFHAQLWTTIHELRRRLEILEAEGATQFSEGSHVN